MIVCSATLDVPEEAARLLVELLVAERLRRGTGVGARAATCRQQAIVVLRWFREDADMKILVQIVGDPTGFPVAVSDVEPGLTHDLTQGPGKVVVVAG